MQRRYVGLLAVMVVGAALGALAGCGGGGGAAGGGSGTLGFYVADGFGDNYSQVWMTLYKVEASADGTTYSTLYSSSAGMPIDLSALSSTAQLVSAQDMPAGNLAKVRITMADHLHLVPTGSASSVDAPVDTSGGTDANGQYTFVMDMPAHVAAGQIASMVMDFDLGSFQMVGNQVQMSVHNMDAAHFAQMHAQGDMEGTVSNLVPGSGFDLTSAAGMMGGGMMRTMSVHLTSSTVVLSNATGQNATLANGQRVEVEGTVDPASMTVTATTIRIEDGAGSGGQHGGAGAQGTVGSVNASAGSFTLAPTWVQNFAPSGATVTVQTNAGTVFTKGMMMGGTATFSDVTAGASVMVTGSYDPSTSVLTALRVMIDR